MTRGVVELSIAQFAVVYLLLLIVAYLMKRSKIEQTKFLLVASARMTVQLFLAGLVLTYIFEHPHPLFTVLYLTMMASFSVYRVLSLNPGLNKRFKIIIALSLIGSGLFIIAFFVAGIVRVDLFDPQYTIPLSGMLFGQAMTGLNLAIKTFVEDVRAQGARIESLLNLGVAPRDILLPFVNNALSTALLPTMNLMVGMGIVSLPGMMSGQILSGTLPMTAILYQIAVTIAICTVVCLAVFCALHFGYRTFYNNRNQMLELVTSPERS